MNKANHLSVAQRYVIEALRGGAYLREHSIYSPLQLANFTRRVHGVHVATEVHRGTFLALKRMGLIVHDSRTLYGVSAVGWFLAEGAVR